MTVYVGLLRAVNVGPGTGVPMETLRRLLKDAGLEEVRTLLQSGNLVFRSPGSHGAALERDFSGRIVRAFRVRTELFLRTREEWQAILAGNPFPREAKDDPAHLLVLTLRDSPAEDRWKALAGAIRGREQVRAGGRHGYLVYPDGIGRSKLTPAVIERHLGTSGTARNWNTARKLADLAESLGGSAPPAP